MHYLSQITCHIVKFLCSIRNLNLWVEICGKRLWKHIWFEGSPLPDDAVDESREVGKSSTTVGSGTINESEIDESEETNLGESKREVKTTMTNKNIVTALSMLIFAMIPMTMLIYIFD